MDNFTGCLLEIVSDTSGFYLRSKVDSSLRINNMTVVKGFYLITHFIENIGGQHLLEILYNDRLIMIKFSEQNCRIINN